jgi:hypothetical protein
MLSRGPRALLLSLSTVLAFGTAGCVESAVYDKATSQLDQARHLATQKDEQIRTYEWQLATLGQQLRDAQGRSDAVQHELHAQVQLLTAESASLAERLKKLESERASWLATAGEATARDGKGGPRPDELRRLIAANDARNAQIADELARIERLLGNGGRARGGDDAPRRPTAGDVVDPWGFGSRK